MKALAHKLQGDYLPALITLGFAGLGVVATMLALQDLLVAAGLVYIALYATLAWRRPDVALVFVFAAAPFQADVGGGGAVAFSIAEVNLGLTSGVFLVKHLLARRRLTLGPLTVPILLYFAACAMTTILNWDGGFAGENKTSLVAFAQMVLYMVLTTWLFCYFAPRDLDLLKPLYAVLVVAVFLGCVALATGKHYFLGMQKNGVGSSLACALVIGVELWFATPPSRKRSLIALATAFITVALIFMLSRGAWLSAIAGVVVVASLRRQFGLLFRVGVILGPIIALCWWALPDESKAYATGFEAERHNIQKRYESIEFAQRVFDTSPIFGDGIQWRKNFDSTNLFWVTLAETGVVGVVTLAGVFATVLWLAWETQKRFPRASPMFSLAVLGGALSLGKMLHGMVDQYWSRGPILMCWACVGMTLRLYLKSRGERQGARGK